MTADEYRAALAAFTPELSQVKAGKLLGVNERTSRRYAKTGVPAFASDRVRSTLYTAKRASEGVGE